MFSMNFEGKFVSYRNWSRHETWHQRSPSSNRISVDDCLLNFSVAPEEGYSCLTEILGIKVTFFSHTVSLSIGFML